MLYENADKIWDDFAKENQQKGRQEGRARLAYEMVLKARLDRMTSDQLLKSLDEIVANALVADKETAG